MHSGIAQATSEDWLWHFHDGSLAPTEESLSEALPSAAGGMVCGLSAASKCFSALRSMLSTDWKTIEEAAKGALETCQKLEALMQYTNIEMTNNINNAGDNFMIFMVADTDVKDESATDSVFLLARSCKAGALPSFPAWNQVAAHEDYELAARVATSGQRQETRSKSSTKYALPMSQKENCDVRGVLLCELQEAPVGSHDALLEALSLLCCMTATKWEQLKQLGTNKAFQKLSEAMVKHMENTINEKHSHRQHDILKSVCKVAEDLTMCERTALWLCDGDELVLRQGSQLCSGLRIPKDQGLAGYCARTGGLVHVRDAYSDQRFDNTVDNSSGFRTRSVLCVPISNRQAKKTRPHSHSGTSPVPEGDSVSNWSYEPYDDEADYRSEDGTDSEEEDGKDEACLNNPRKVFAVLQFINPQQQENDCVVRTSSSLREMWTPRKTQASDQRAFSRSDIEFAQRLCRGPVALATRIAMMIGQLLTERSLKDSVWGLMDRLNKSNSIEELFENITCEVQKVIGCQQCSFFFVSKHRNKVWSPATESWPGFSEHLCPSAKSIVAHVAQTGEPYMSNNPNSDPIWKGEVPGAQFKTQNLLTVPVMSAEKHRHDRVVGVIQVLNKQAFHHGAWKTCNFPEDDLKLLQLLSAEVSAQLGRIKVDLLMEEARHDLDATTREYVNLFYEESNPDHPSTASSNKRRSQCLRGFNSVVSLSSIVGDHAEVSLTPPVNKSPSQDGGTAGMNAGSWDVVHFELETFEQQLAFGNSVARGWGLFEDDGGWIPIRKFSNFFSAIRGEYLNTELVPYHNFFHGLSTLHLAYLYVEEGGAARFFSDVDLGSLLLAALGHDAGHRGRNNAFEMAIEAPDTAIVYNDVSVLEMMHASKTWRAVQASGLLEHLGAKKAATLRRRMCSGIIQTDMKFHGDHVRTTSQLQLDDDYYNFGGDLDALEDQRQSLMETILHTADIGNPTMSAANAMLWRDALVAEFTAQAAEEEARGLPVTPFMRGLRESQEALANSQIGFINFVVQPMLSALAVLLNGLPTAQEHITSNLQDNQQMLEDARKAPDSPPALPAT